MPGTGPGHHGWRHGARQAPGSGSFPVSSPVARAACGPIAGLAPGSGLARQAAQSACGCLALEVATPEEEESQAMQLLCALSKPVS